MSKITVSANGLSIVHQKSGGKAMASIPDICITPFPAPPGPLPLPYPNFAESEKLELGSVMTKFDGASVALLGSTISESYGDESGSIGGVASGQTKGKASFLISSPNVSVEMRPVCRKSDMMIMNGFNTLSLGGMDQADVKEPGEINEETMDIEVELLDDENNPIADEPYQIIHSGKVEAEGKTDSSGMVKISGITKRGYKVIFPERSAAEADKAGS